MNNTLPFVYTQTSDTYHPYLKLLYQNTVSITYREDNGSRFRSFDSENSGTGVARLNA